MSRLGALFSTCLLCIAIQAQTPDTAGIHGHVNDQSHAAIADVTVTARNPQTGLQRTAQTDASGSFSLPGLPIAGEYDITATRQGFADARMTGVTLAGGTTAEINLE